MKQFTKTEGKHVLTITVDDENLLKTLSEKESEYQKILNFYEKEKAAGEPHTDSEKEYFTKGYGKEFIIDHDMQSVYGDGYDDSDICTPSEILADIKEMKDLIASITDETIDEYFAKLPRKKNGTFNKTCKPTLHESINGCYWEDSYGWNTLVLRLVPTDDKNAVIEFDNIVLHY